MRRPDPAPLRRNRRFWDEFFFAKTIGPRQLWAATTAEWTRLARTPHPEAPDDPATRERILERLLGDMARAAGSVDARLIVLNIPYFERGGTGAMPAPLKDALARVAAPNLSVLDLAPIVERHYADPSAPLLRFDRDRHPNPAAHALIGGRHRRLRPGPGPPPGLAPGAIIRPCNTERWAGRG